MPRYDVVVHEAAIVAELFCRYVEVGVSLAELARWLTRQRWCRVSISDLERHQLKMLSAELGLDPPPVNNDQHETNRRANAAGDRRTPSCSLMPTPAWLGLSHRRAVRSLLHGPDRFDARASGLSVCRG